MDNNSSRRDFLKWMGAVTLGFSGLQSFANSIPLDDREVYGYGPLYDKGIIKLPKGFSYKIISKAGVRMDDGLILPGRPDGMGTFKGSDGRVLVVRNHENSPSQVEHSPFGAENELLNKVSDKKIFDRGFGKTPHIGGTTNFLYNEQTQEIEHTFMSLVGTARNCAGGITPWGSWLTCEEYVSDKSEHHEENHGYVFEVPAKETKGLKYPVPLRAMGRFNHEAVAVDPRTGIVYLTEDRYDGLFYRFIPKVKGELHKRGKLQALAFVWKKSMDTRNRPNINIKEGIKYAARWIDMEDVDADGDNLRIRGFEQGAACFARAEGIWFGKGELFFACTNGGRQKTGQIFRYTPSKYEGNKREKEDKYRPRIELFAEPNDTKLLKYCDNLTVAPWGDIVFCEDHRHKPRISGITPGGKFYKISQNIEFACEFAGVCFSPSGKTLFVNIQDEGLTLAITGPWLKRKI
ncbi:MAG: DUF839 domain-containing protein [Aureispira sp.]|nr:DUF839 domain-containing protein [Aureispira sp.]